MKKKYRKHKYGRIHGVCIFIKTELFDYCYPLDNFESESILWIHLKHTFLQCNFLLGAAYIPHEMSDYNYECVFEYLTNDIITIKSSYDIPIILLGYFNSRTNIVTDLEDIFEHEGSILERNPHKLFLEKQGIHNRANEDKHLNNIDRKLIEMCKMSDLKIVNGRVGRDRHIKNYACYTSRPLYKNKDPITDPDNYRGITLLSCTSKLFTACLNRR